MKALRTIAIHVFLAILFLSIPFFLNLSFDKKEMMYRDLFYYSLILGLFYLNYFFLIDRYYFTKRLLSYFSMIAIAIIGIYIATEFMVFSDFPPKQEQFTPRKPPMPENVKFRPGVFNKPHHRPGDKMNLMKFSHDFFIFIASIFLSIMLKTKGRMEKIEEEKTLAELSYLKPQINPHFIFNILNTLYSLSLENSNKTPDAILKLSTMMRYVLDNAANEVISLSDELKQIETYIELQRLRFGETIDIDFIANNDSINKTIQPLLLIPFIENTFKHGVNPEVESKITIRIDVSDCILELYTHNKKVINETRKDAESGLGIEITRSRIEQLYPMRHELIINDNRDEFEVKLKIELC